MAVVKKDVASMHGIPMTEEAFEQLIHVESPYRYELIGGFAFDMTGSSPEHADISSNIETLFKEQLGRRGPCRVYREQYVAIPGQPSVIPDVVITCDVQIVIQRKGESHFKYAPAHRSGSAFTQHRRL